MTSQHKYRAKARLRMVVVCMTVILVGCSNDTSSNSDTVTEEDIASLGHPISDFVGGYSSESPDVDEAEMRRSIEEDILACMQAAGFDFIPRPAEATPYQNLVAVDTKSIEGMEQYGLGLSTLILSSEELPDDLVGTPEAESQGAVVDPNEEIRANLSDGDLTAYDRAFGGIPTSLGCENSAYESAAEMADERSGGGVEFFTLQELLDEQLKEFFERAKADPRVVDLATDTDRCLADAGLGERSLDSLIVYLSGESQQLYILAQDFADGPDAALPSDVLEPLRELQSLEFAAADALIACDLSLEVVEHRFLEVVKELEEQFLRENYNDLVGQDG